MKILTAIKTLRKYKSNLACFCTFEDCVSEYIARGRQNFEIDPGQAERIKLILAHGRATIRLTKKQVRESERLHAAFIAERAKTVKVNVTYQ